MIKKIIVIGLLSIASIANAQWHNHYPQRTVVVNNNDWVGPLIIGGIAGALIVRESQKPQPIIVQQPVVEPQLVIMNGIVYKKQFIYVDGVLTEVLVRV